MDGKILFGMKILLMEKEPLKKNQKKSTTNIY